MNEKNLSDKNAASRYTVLIVDDDPKYRMLISSLLEKLQLSTLTASDGKEGLDMVEKHHPELVVTDINMPVMSGLEMAGEIKSKHPELPIIVLTAFCETGYLIKAIEIGVDRLIRKPLDQKELKDAITHCSVPILQRKEIYRLNRQLDNSMDESLGKSESMKELFSRIHQLAASDFSLILQGETGVGKSYIARLIHKLSKRSSGPFITVDIGAIPESLVESELFGHKKGAFTGASGDKKGLFENANKGTIFLDELENLTPYVQSKLLLAVEEKKIQPLGGASPVDVDIRIVAATNKDLDALVAEKTFRQDLFYRLNDFSIHIPPLKERTLDIALFARRFMLETSEELDKNVYDLSPDALDLLEKYPWPGNIRELKSVIRRAVFFCSGGCLTAETILNALKSKENTLLFPKAPDLPEEGPPSNLSLEEVEKWGIRQALQRTNGKKMQAAVLLKIGYSTLIRKMERYGIR
jgi:DNA-binding NtrC family response regulator